VVKTHGSSDALTFSNAINYALSMAKNDVNGKIKYHAEKLDAVKKSLTPAPAGSIL
jgi:fatty acid/phospholipid biosynthesis enzyme